MSKPHRSIEQLLSTARFGLDYPDFMTPERSPFEVDADRIIFSDAFRLLDDKTQVHGKTGSDYTRSRLTHSMEVACIARSLGNSVGQSMIDRHGGSDVYRPADIGHVLYAACLMHDIGNPPFGHSAEEIIGDFFRSHALGQEILERLDPRLKTELTHHEGNAQGFRIVSRLQGWKPGYGLQLTAATLVATGKYPYAADPAIGTGQTKHKYGFFSSELDLYQWIADKTGLIPKDREFSWRRHPLAYLVEAADDTSYLIVDIEDAAELGLINLDIAEDMLMPLINENEKAPYMHLSTKQQKLVFLRAKAISNLVQAVSGMYADIADKLDDGTHPGDIIYETEFGQSLKDIRNYSRSHIYKNPEREAMDKKARISLEKLLIHYVNAFLLREKTEGAVIEPILKTIPELGRIGYGPDQWVRPMIDTISLMTDSKALTIENALNIFS